MAEKLVKSIKDKPSKIRKEKGLEAIPEDKPKEKPPKISKAKDSVIRKRFLGNPQMGILPNKKAGVIKNGCKIK